MKRWIVLCAVLVLVQIGLTVATHLNGRGNEVKAAKGPLLSLQGVTIDGLLLEDDKGQQLRVQKIKDRWVLPASDNFPADSTHIEGLLEKLTKLQRGWPEATTAEAASRFKVTENGFVHKMTLLQDDKPASVVYFGTSPGLRKLYLRANKDVEIHSLATTSQELDTKVEHWIDTTALYLKPEHIMRVDLPGLVLKRSKDGLQPEGLQEGEEVIKDRLEALLDRLAHLSIINVLGKESKSEYGMSAPALQYTVELEGGTTVTYAFGQPPKPATVEGKGQDVTNAGEPPALANKVVLKVSTQEQFLQVDGWQVDELKRANRASMIKATTKE